ncbi:ABC transporter ATP-binding protein [Microbacterium sp. NPDC058342]|uniref:ABC transporter ATP-binding protein n=1 Tax=Microbacterium sp. NPDC058342 TaxID=3346454 RepID=UPI00365B0A3E
MSENAELLSVEGLTIDFPTARVVEAVSFSIERGNTLGVVGESGSGKSMTALSIMGLLSAKASVTGSIRLQGQELIGASERSLQRLRGNRVAMIFQDPLSSLNPYLTVGFQIAEAYLAHRRVSRRVARMGSIEAMERVRIPDAARRHDDFPHQFSGGMRQRIMIAMALVCEPELIIADEPTTALDVTVQAEILSLIAELQQSSDASMLFITHDLAVVSEIADHVAVMRSGHLVEYAPVERLFSSPENEYTRRLLDATPRLVDPVTRGGLR